MIGSSGPIVNPRNPTISSRAIFFAARPGRWSAPAFGRVAVVGGDAVGGRCGSDRVGEVPRRWRRRTVGVPLTPHGGKPGGHGPGGQPAQERAARDRLEATSSTPTIAEPPRRREAERSDVAAERVAGGRVAAVVAGPEPLLALLRRSVRPRIGVDLALGRLLDPVVADRRRGVEGVRDLRPAVNGSRKPVLAAWLAQTPAKQSAWSSIRTAWLSAPVSPPPVSRTPSRSWTWWPYSWATTYPWASEPPCAPNRVRSSPKKSRSM